MKTLKNAKFYVAKFAHEDKIVFAARKTDSSWTTRNSKTILNAIYKENELDISLNEGFRIQRSFDFFVNSNQLLVASKKHFESILNYRAAHEGDFAALRADESFSEKFADVDPLTQYVGTNRMQLRRMSAIKEKGFYANEEFMNNLRAKYQAFGLNINFDEHGNIVATAETCADIMTALLDHRLQSAFSGNTYDVPDAVQVQ